MLAHILTRYAGQLLAPALWANKESIVLVGPIAELQIKPKSKSNQTKNLERQYNWVVVVLVVVVVCMRRLGTRTNMSATEVE